MDVQEYTYFSLQRWRAEKAEARIAELERQLAAQPCVRRDDAFPPKSDEECGCCTCNARIKLTEGE